MITGKPAAIRGVGIIFVLALLGISACSGPVEETGTQPAREESAAAEQSFPDFWDAFRAAALDSDVEKVLTMTQLPFLTRGALDSDPAAKHDAASFRLLFSTLLQQDVGVSVEPEPMLEYLRRTPTAAAEGDLARVGQFQFAKIQGKWMFVSAYLEE